VDTIKPLKRLTILLRPLHRAKATVLMKRFQAKRFLLRLPWLALVPQGRQAIPTSQ
jgi:hypothetical protein